jgi:hypothetical protein
MLMDENFRHIFGRLDNLEAELAELRAVTWPVCQGLVDKQTGPFQNMKEKRKFFKFLHVDDIRNLLKAKARFMGISPEIVYEELRQVRVEEPRLDAV